MSFGACEDGFEVEFSGSYGAQRTLERVAQRLSLSLQAQSWSPAGQPPRHLALVPNRGAHATEERSAVGAVCVGAACATALNVAWEVVGTSLFAVGLA